MREEWLGIPVEQRKFDALDGNFQGVDAGMVFARVFRVKEKENERSQNNQARLRNVT